MIDPLKKEMLEDLGFTNMYYTSIPDWLNDLIQTLITAGWSKK